MNTVPPIFVISLARATERRTDIARQLDALGICYEFSEAVDGKNSDLSQYAERLKDIDYCKKKIGVEFDSGSIGCYLSHYHLFEKMAKESIPYAVILEDDAEVESGFMRVVADVINCEWQWDVVILHAPGRRGNNRIICELCNNRKLVQYQRHPFATVAYLINLEAAKKLCDYLYYLRLPIDSAWKPWWNYGVQFYCVSPQVATNSGAVSTILQVAQETGGYDDKAGSFNLVQMNWQGRVLRSLLNKQERFFAWFYYHIRRPRKK